MNPMVLAFLVLVGSMSVGCMRTVDSEDGATAEVSSALIGENSIDTNGIDTNGLLTNGIDTNGLDPQLLSSDAYSAITDPGANGDDARLLYKYLIGCALSSTQSISFSWLDSYGALHQEVYWGALGLAPTWINTSLTLINRRWVSACIGARSNYYGVPVMISLRGPHSAIKHLGPIEQASYPMEEGAFWGDLFDGTPQIHSCYKGTNVTHSRSKMRECAAGHVTTTGIVECGNIAIRGNCDTLCDPLDQTNYYRPRCLNSETGMMTGDLVTVFLTQ